MEKEIINSVFEKMKTKDFGESMCDETKLKVLKWCEKQLHKHFVSNRRELLIAYGEWIHELAGCKDTEKATTLADSYLSNL